MTTTVHIFHYRWPRIKEGLTHKELPFTGLFPEAISIPEGGFMRYDSQWWATLRTSTNRLKNYITTEDQVPKDIRALALIVI